MIMLFKFWIFMIVNFYFYFVLLYILFYDIDMKIYEEDWKYFFGGKKEFLI